MDHIDSYEVPQILSTQKPMGNQLNKELFFSVFFFFANTGVQNQNTSSHEMGVSLVLQRLGLESAIWTQVAFQLPHREI